MRRRFQAKPNVGPKVGAPALNPDPSKSKSIPAVNPDPSKPKSIPAPPVSLATPASLHDAHSSPLPKAAPDSRSSDDKAAQETAADSATTFPETASSRSRSPKKSASLERGGSEPTRPARTSRSPRKSTGPDQVRAQAAVAIDPVISTRSGNASPGRARSPKKSASKEERPRGLSADGTLPEPAAARTPSKSTSPGRARSPQKSALNSKEERSRGLSVDGALLEPIAGRTPTRSTSPLKQKAGQAASEEKLDQAASRTVTETRILPKSPVKSSGEEACKESGGTPQGLTLQKGSGPAAKPVGGLRGRFALKKMKPNIRASSAPKQSQKLPLEMATPGDKPACSQKKMEEEGGKEAAEAVQPERLQPPLDNSVDAQNQESENESRESPSSSSSCTSLPETAELPVITNPPTETASVTLTVQNTHNSEKVTENIADRDSENDVAEEKTNAARLGAKPVHPEALKSKDVDRGSNEGKEMMDDVSVAGSERNETDTSYAEYDASDSLSVEECSMEEDGRESSGHAEGEETEKRHAGKKSRAIKSALASVDMENRDINKMKMKDLIYWNPRSTPENTIVKKASSSTPARTAPVEVVVEDSMKDEESSNHSDSLVPQVKIGPDGDIILNMDSTVVEQKLTETTETVDEDQDRYITSRSFSKNTVKKRWTKAETECFYKSLSLVGTDFTMMQTILKHRTRNDIKNKFVKEEKVNRHLIDEALKECRVFDRATLDKAMQEAQEEQRKALLALDKKVAVKEPRRAQPRNTLSRLKKEKRDDSLLAQEEEEEEKKALSEQTENKRKRIVQQFGQDGNFSPFKKSKNQTEVAEILANMSRGTRNTSRPRYYGEEDDDDDDDDCSSMTSEFSSQVSTADENVFIPRALQYRPRRQQRVVEEIPDCTVPVPPQEEKAGADPMYVIVEDRTGEEGQGQVIQAAGAEASPLLNVVFVQEGGVIQCYITDTPDNPPGSAAGLEQAQLTYANSQSLLPVGGQMSAAGAQFTYANSQSLLPVGGQMSAAGAQFSQGLIVGGSIVPVHSGYLPLQAQNGQLLASNVLQHGTSQPLYVHNMPAHPQPVHSVYEQLPENSSNVPEHTSSLPVHSTDVPLLTSNVPIYADHAYLHAGSALPYLDPAGQTHTPGNATTLPLDNQSQACVGQNLAAEQSVLDSQAAIGSNPQPSSSIANPARKAELITLSDDTNPVQQSAAASSNFAAASQAPRGDSLQSLGAISGSVADMLTFRNSLDGIGADLNALSLPSNWHRPMLTCEAIVTAHDVEASAPNQS